MVKNWFIISNCKNNFTDPSKNIIIFYSPENYIGWCKICKSFFLFVLKEFEMDKFYFLFLKKKFFKQNLI
jgi:hypothetical protein